MGLYHSNESRTSTPHQPTSKSLKVGLYDSFRPEIKESKVVVLELLIVEQQFYLQTHRFTPKGNESCIATLWKLFFFLCCGS